MSKLSNLLVFVNKQGHVEIKDFSGGIPDEVLETCVQLDEILYNLIDDKILDPQDLIRIANLFKKVG